MAATITTTPNNTQHFAKCTEPSSFSYAAPLPPPFIPPSIFEPPPSGPFNTPSNNNIENLIPGPPEKKAVDPQVSPSQPEERPLRRNLSFSPDSESQNLEKQLQRIRVDDLILEPDDPDITFRNSTDNQNINPVLAQGLEDTVPQATTAKVPTDGATSVEAQNTPLPKTPHGEESLQDSSNLLEVPTYLRGFLMDLVANWSKR